MALHDIERKQDLADLPPKCCFVSTQPVECEVGQIDEMQKATRELGDRVGGRFARFDRRSAGGFVMNTSASADELNGDAEIVQLEFSLCRRPEAAAQL